MSNVMSLNISDKVIEAAIREEVNAGIVRALGNPEDVVRDAIKSMTNQYVDKQTGEITRKNHYNSIPYFDWLAKNTIETCVREEIEKYINENKEEFAEEIRKQLSEYDFQKNIAAGFIQAVLDQTRSSWGMPITVSFEPDRYE